MTAEIIQFPGPNEQFTTQEALIRIVKDALINAYDLSPENKKLVIEKLETIINDFEPTQAPLNISIKGTFSPEDFERVKKTIYEIHGQLSMRHLNDLASLIKVFIPYISEA